MKSLKPDKDELASKQQTILDEMITFSETYNSYCVGIVDIVDSTRITALLTKPKMCQYYSVFLNSMAVIIKKYGGIVIKYWR